MALSRAVRRFVGLGWELQGGKMGVGGFVQVVVVGVCALVFSVVAYGAKLAARSQHLGGKGGAEREAWERAQRGSKAAGCGRMWLRCMFLRPAVRCNGCTRGGGM